MKRIRTFRELQAAPDELLCDDQDVASQHKLQVPFWISRMVWKGGGVVAGDIKSNAEGYFSPQGYPVTAYTSLRHLFWPDNPPQPGDLPTQTPAWESKVSIAAAAIRVGERIFTGETHVEAIAKLVRTPRLSAEEKIQMILSGEAGFITDDGQFVDRGEASRISQQAGVVQ